MVQHSAVQGVRRPQPHVRRAACTGLAAVWLISAGCANPGPPRPPSLHLPAPVKDLHVERVGSSLLLHWTNPATTTDGAALAGEATARLCVEADAGQGYLLTRTQSAPSGPVELRLDLPPGLTTGADRVLHCSLEISNQRGRSAGPGPAVAVLAGIAPEPMGDLRLTARQEGVEVTWRAHATAGETVEVTRSMATHGPAELANRTGKPVGPVHLTPAGMLERTPDSLPDPGGMLDRDVPEDAAATYVAQRVRRVRLQGLALELRGEPSAPATIVYRNDMPLAPPRGLLAIPLGGFGAPAAIDLSWEATTGRGLAGYTVYRSAGGPFMRLNAAPQSATAYRDMAVEPGHTYSYRVTATGPHAIESAPGNVVSETAPQ